MLVPPAHGSFGTQQLEHAQRFARRVLSPVLRAVLLGQAEQTHHLQTCERRTGPTVSKRSGAAAGDSPRSEMVVGIGQVWPIPRGPQSGCLSSLVRAPAVGGVRASSAAPPAPVRVVPEENRSRRLCACAARRKRMARRAWYARTISGREKAQVRPPAEPRDAAPGSTSSRTASTGPWM